MRIKRNVFRPVGGANSGSSEDGGVTINSADQIPALSGTFGTFLSIPNPGDFAKAVAKAEKPSVEDDGPAVPLGS